VEGIFLYKPFYHCLSIWFVILGITIFGFYLAVMPIGISSAEPIFLEASTSHKTPNKQLLSDIPTPSNTVPSISSSVPSQQNQVMPGSYEREHIDQQVHNDVLLLRNLSLRQEKSTLKRRSVGKTKLVALTFDDGPSPYTPQILKILKQYQIRATFFVLGEQAQHNPDIIRQIHEEGHVIGNHTWTHSNLTRLSATQIQHEIESTNQLLESLIGESPHLIRPPYGSVNSSVQKMIHKMGMSSVMWNVDPTDWNLKQTDSVSARVFSGLRQNNVILLHDGGGPRDQTVASLPLIIEKLQKQDYEFVTVPEYLALQSSI
jgi:peptidoglycan/xylan/chitin deacetylase (PgdA/CDA1 family)